MMYTLANERISSVEGLFDDEKYDTTVDYL